MTREKLIKKTVDSLSKLPDQKIKEVADFADFLLSKIDDQITVEGIQKIATESKTFAFLEVEEDVYTVEDLKTQS